MCLAVRAGESLSLSSLIEEGDARLLNNTVSCVKEAASRESKSRCLSSQEGSGEADPWRLGSHWVGTTASFTSQDWLSALSTLDVRRGSGGGVTPRGSGGGVTPRGSGGGVTPRGSGGGAAFIFQS
jgi:hypothetical protein